MVRNRIATAVMSGARSLGRTLGTELVVECSDHSLDLKMEVPNSNSGRAWDPDLYRRGQLYWQGYANPFKPTIKREPDPQEHDHIEVEGSDERPGEDLDDGEEIGMVPSSRYRAYLDQHLISELVRPEQRWQLLVYAVLGIALLQMVTIVALVHFN